MGTRSPGPVSFLPYLRTHSWKQFFEGLGKEGKKGHEVQRNYQLARHSMKLDSHDIN